LTDTVGQDIAIGKQERKQQQHQHQHLKEAKENHQPMSPQLAQVQPKLQLQQQMMALCCLVGDFLHGVNGQTPVNALKTVISPVG